jgi:phosphohistidine phosphatase SixA
MQGSDILWIPEGFGAIKKQGLRHADALDPWMEKLTNFGHFLREGREECRIPGEFLKRKNVTFDVAYPSPLNRAIERLKNFSK